MAEIRIGGRVAYIHGNDGKVRIHMPDEARRDDVHNESNMTAAEARNLARALNRAAKESNQ